MIYLDWASTSPPDRAYLEAGLSGALETYGNPSSTHPLGRAARASMDSARKTILEALGPGPGRIVFTSGGSEADAMVLLASLRRMRTGSRPSHLIVSSIEHSAIYEEAGLLEGLGIEVSYVAPGPDGRVPPEAVAAALRRDTVLVCVMAVNNETGAVQDLPGIAQALKAASASLGRREPPHFHADGVQALGKIPFSPGHLGIDSAAFSAHKIRGPRGSGALWLKGKLEPLVLGGGQEEGLRPGTENLQGALGFAAAAQGAVGQLEEARATARILEARLLAGLAGIPGALPLPLGREPGSETYSPFILSVAFPGLGGEVLARILADQGVAVSTGAACSTNAHRKGRRVLDAMGLPEEISGSAIRVSTGSLTTPADIDAFLERAAAAYRQFRT